VSNEEERLLLRWEAPDEGVWVIMRVQPVAPSMVDAAVELIRNEQGAGRAYSAAVRRGQPSS
jgi:hypothetical protein